MVCFTHVHPREHNLIISMTHLSLANVTASYVNKRTATSLLALQNITLTINEGEFVAIVGPSGCGKSTLLNLIAGLQAPQSGEIILNGQPIQGPGRDRAMVFQVPALLPWRTVLANVSYGLELQGVPALEAKKQALRFIDLVGLSDFVQSFPNELSGGMQQRANLARALAVEPSLLLMDEPLSALDAILRESMQAEIQRIWQESRQSVLYVTHQIDEAIFLADRVIVMSDRPGRIEKIIQVRLSRPRQLSIKQHPSFVQLSEEIWQSLQQGMSTSPKSLSN